jgi:hypothetical protein
VYWALLPEDDTHWVLGYWFFYAYNGFKGNRHEGDWEMIALELELRSRLPLAFFSRPFTVKQAVYSAHEGRLRRPWPKVEKTADGHPLVYVAGLSHANYFTAGTYKASVPVVGFHGHSFVVKANDVADGNRCTLYPSQYGLALLDGPAFHGAFGPANFLAHGFWVPRPNQPPTQDPRAQDTWREPRQFFAIAEPDHAVGSSGQPSPPSCGAQGLP